MSVLRVVLGTSGALASIAASVACLGCNRSPSSAELDSWLAEARREDEALRAKVVASEAATWSIAVRGNVANGGSDYPWPKINALAKTHVKTTDPTHTSDVNAVLDYRGILISDLLDQSGAREEQGPGGAEVTIVAADGFLHARPLSDVKKFPILLAIERDGVPLVRKTGGPVLETMPHSSHPETKKIYAEGGAYYVTTLIVGTEPLALAVGGRTLRAADMPVLGERSVLGKAGFKFRWPSSPVKISGPRLRDVLAAANVPLRPGERVLVRRKSRTDTPEREVTTLRSDDVLACDVIIGLRYGDAHQLIPATLGGPAVLAFSPACPKAANNQAWPMFVESITVEAETDAGAKP